MLDTFEFDNPSPEQWQEYCRGKFRKHPPWKKWLLRSNVHTANRVLECDQCYIPILPGDSYMEEIYACKGKIEVKRYHWPECPHDFDPWDEDEDEDWDSDFDNNPQTVLYHAPLRRAA